MKTFLAPVLCFGLVSALTACSSDPDASDSTPASSDATTASTTASSSASTSAGAGSGGALGTGGASNTATTASTSQSSTTSGSGGAGGDGACVLSDKLVPSCGALWGISESPRKINGVEETEGEALARIEKATGRVFDITHTYHVDAEVFPTAQEVEWSKEGRLLLINWKPSSASWATAASGSIDASVIGPAADRIKAFGTKFFLAIYHEPENNIPGAGMPTDYIAMWKHVRAVFDQKGVKNVVWVWNMMGYEGWSNLYETGALYPGDSYVDWISEDSYKESEPDFATTLNHGKGSWPGFYAWATATHPGKPIMVSETGAKEVANDPMGKAKWYESMPTAIATTRPEVKAIVQWDGSFSTDLACDTTADSLAGYSAAGKNPMFGVLGN